MADPPVPRPTAAAARWDKTPRRTSTLPDIPPTDDAMMPRAVFGDDDRERIDDRGFFPWNCMVCLVTVWPGERTSMGSGWLISPLTVVTAGHNLYRKDGRCLRARTVSIEAGRQRSTWSVGTTAPEEWKSAGARGSDYGAIRLERPIERARYLTPAALDDASVALTRFAVAGFPIDKPLGSLWAHYGGAWLGPDPSDRLLYHRIDTWEGSSGAPILVQSAGDWSVAGVHTWGGNDSNWGVRMTTEVARTVVGWSESSS